MDAMSFLFGGNGQSLSDQTATIGNQYVGNQQLQQGYGQGSQQAMGQAAPQMDPNQQAQFRAMQMAQAQQLQGVASGQQQGAGELAVQRQMANAQAAQQAQANMVRGGGNSGMAFRNAAVNQAGIAQSGFGQAQQAALSDQQAAQGALTNVTNAGRTQDQSLALNNANLTQQQFANNNTANLGYLNGLNQLGQNQMGDAVSAQNGAQASTGVAGSLLNAAGGAAATAAFGPKPPAPSDRRLKKDIRNASKDIDDMLDGLKAKTYRYKDDAIDGPSARAGIMAQDLERSKAGKAIVVDLPDRPGMKGFDVNRALSAALAATARLNERLRKVEGH